MKNILAVLSLVIAPSFGFAETTTYKVSGMHCAGCANMIKAEVCKMEGLETCTVTVGKVVITPKASAKISQAQVQEALSKVGDYNITEAKTAK